MASIAEVADNIYRVNVEVPGSPVTFSFFVIKDDLPTLVETAQGRMFNETIEAVKQLIDPSTLRYIVIPHFEGDECGALNHFLDLAPHAQPVCSPIGAVTNISDFATREPLAVEEGQVLDLGQHRLQFLMTPYVHTWDGMLPFEQSTRTQFCSDVFIQPGSGPPTTDQALIEPMLETYRHIGIFPSRVYLNSALDKIEALNPKVLACHHGSVVTGQITSYIQALREHDVTGLTEWNPMREQNY
jgi:flavorubredoxin